MATATTSPSPAAIDWRQEWHEFDNATYLNLAGQSPVPKVAIRAIQSAIEWKKFPHNIPDSAYFDTPNKIRASIAKLIGGKPDEVALTAGASTGMLAVAYGLTWKPGDEILTAVSEFPLQYTTWKPMEEREGIKLVLVPSIAEVGGVYQLSGLLEDPTTGTVQRSAIARAVPLQSAAYG